MGGREGKEEVTRNKRPLVAAQGTSLVVRVWLTTAKSLGISSILPKDTLQNYINNSLERYIEHIKTTFRKKIKGRNNTSFKGLERIVSRVLALHPADLSFITGTLTVPQATPGLIPEDKARIKP